MKEEFKEVADRLTVLMIKAWEERWSVAQWGLALRSILPRGADGDDYNFADIIFSQSLNGYYPNEYLLSYLKYSIDWQIVSYAAIFKCISKFVKFNKKLCIVVLLDFLHSTVDGILKLEKPENEIVLANSLMSLVDWLLKCIQCGQVPKDGTKNELDDRIASTAIKVLIFLLSTEFIYSLLFLAKHDNPDLYLNIVQKCQDIIEDVNNTVNSNIPDACPVLTRLSNIDLNYPHRFVEIESTNTSNEPILTILQPILAIHVSVISPQPKTDVLLNKIKIIHKIKGCSKSQLYFGLFHASLLSFRHSYNIANNGLLWGVFIFKTLPEIIKNLCDFSDGAITPESSTEVVLSLNLLSEVTPLLDYIDSSTACNSIQYLSNKLLCLNIINKEQCDSIVAKRASEVSLDSNFSGQKSNALTIILETEPTLKRLLKLNDYSQIQDALVIVLGQVFSENKLELILSTSVHYSTLHELVANLIKLNEFCKQNNQQYDTGSFQTRALLFDMSFTILCFVLQKYGYKAIFPDDNINKSFFKSWCWKCLVLPGRLISFENMVAECDQNQVEKLLTAIDKGENIINCDINLEQICVSIVGVVHDVLVAWENSTVDISHVNDVLDSFRTSMFCLPICAAAWLFAYTPVLPKKNASKPLRMIDQLMKALPYTDENQDNFTANRHKLMCQIICKMKQNYEPRKVQVKPYRLLNDSIFEELVPLWNQILDEGWLNMRISQKLFNIYVALGSTWFVKTLIGELMKLKYIQELNKAVDLLFAIFHLDIEFCTLALLDLVPHYLFNPAIRDTELYEPQQSALAKLCSYCIYSAFESQPICIVKNEIDETDIDNDTENVCPSKKIRLEKKISTQVVCTDKDSMGFRALADFFRRIELIPSKNSDISKESMFVLTLIHQLAKCGRGSSQSIQRNLPKTLLPKIICCAPKFITFKLIVNLYDLTWQSDRHNAASNLFLLQQAIQTIIQLTNSS